MNWIDLTKIGTFIISLCVAIGGAMGFFFTTHRKVDNIETKLKEKISRIEIELEHIRKYDKRIHDLELKSAENEAALNILLTSSPKTTSYQQDQKKVK